MVKIVGTKARGENDPLMREVMTALREARLREARRVRVLFIGLLLLAMALTVLALR